VKVLALFADPVVRAPLIGAMLMCLASSLIGVTAYLKKRSLVGEALSHASYPGVVLGVLLFSASPVGVLFFAALSSAVGIGALRLIERRLRIPADAALCFVLATFLGFGILIASRLQLTHALLYRQVQGFLYGQVVTITDGGVALYAGLAAVTVIALILFFREIIASYFDPTFAEVAGIRVAHIERLTFALLILAVVIGIRCVGVALMAAMLIAPPVAARQYTNRPLLLFIIAGCVGLMSGFVGIVASLQGRLLPAGPMVVLAASAFAFFALFFAPRRGLIARTIRLARFKWTCGVENYLKQQWKGSLPSTPKAWHRLLRTYLRCQGWLDSGGLTRDGERKAARIVRLHRLWEVYLLRHVGLAADKVHRSAEEIEHIMTPELERELLELVGDVRSDPHSQPIPEEALLS
jgi:manganese/zinc/iron transport system permease protein